MSRKRAEGRYTVSGPLEDDHAVPNVGAGVSCAQTFANHRRHDEGEFTYYVRGLLGECFAWVTKRKNGVIDTTVLAKRKPK
jgi:hypothetical protein